MKTLDKITAFCGNCKRQTIQEIRRDDTYEGEESAYYKCWRVCLTCYRDFDYPMTKPVLELSDKKFDETVEPLVQVIASLKARVEELEKEVSRFRSLIDKGDLVFRYDMPTDPKRDNAVKLANDEMSAEKNYKWKVGDPVWPPDSPNNETK